MPLYYELCSFLIFLWSSKNWISNMINNIIGDRITIMIEISSFLCISIQRRKLIGNGYPIEYEPKEN